MCRGTAGTGSGGVQDAAGGGGADRAGVPQHVDPLADSSPAPPPRPGDAVMEQLRPRGQNIPSCSRDNVSLLKHALAAQKHFFLLPLDATAGEIKGDGAPGGTWGGGKVAVPKPPLGASAAKTRPRRSPRRGNAADASDAAEGGALRPRVLPLKRRDVNPVPCTAHPGGAFSAPSPQPDGGEMGAAAVGCGRSASGWVCSPPSARLGRGAEGKRSRCDF